MATPLILVSNDDSYAAPGIKFLTACMAKLGNVIVVAPKYPQSGMAHAITVRNPLRLRKLSETHNITEYYCDGTPVDCVKIAVDQVLQRSKPDLVVSGVNHGSNASINVIYSGTASVAMEGAILDIPSIAFSINEFSFDIAFEQYEKYVLAIARLVLEKGLAKHTCLNVNIPFVPASEIKGMRICRQAIGHWVEEYDERKDPGNKDYYWLTGRYVNMDDSEETDIWAMQHNYIAIVPVTTDYTAHHTIPSLKTWDLSC